MKQLDFADERVSGPQVWTVSSIVTAASQHLESRFADIWVEGEISNLKMHGSGHVYFTLKDASAQLDAVLWNSNAKRLKFRLEDGLHVRSHGRLSIYPSRGRFQMYVDRLEPQGLGALQLAFEQLKTRLATEGLFDAARKKPLPFLPRCIGVVTSPSGAALRDFIRVATRRYPVHILIAPAAVQGDEAPGEILRAIDWLEACDQVDVIVLTRGGGSMEDLWAFNDERLARRIAACQKPVVSAVGHEVDFTIADFVADLRVPTPSAAGEQLVPEWETLARTVEMLQERTCRAAGRCIADARQRLDETLTKGQQSIAWGLARRRQVLDRLCARAAEFHPRERLRADRAHWSNFVSRLHAAGRLARDRRQAQLHLLMGKLDSLSPLRVLDRGYALARGADGRLLLVASTVAPGDQVAVRLREGELTCRVEAVK